ncbi:hypothetical protein ADQ49_25605, partial [Salmonella enterica subsp. enterica]|nr:hypothetical protein [Salmonella enterica subsp. enterica serovar Enteritidis]EBB0847976.1 hypothetical protein [Salmonella enterica]
MKNKSGDDIRVYMGVSSDLNSGRSLYFRILAWLNIACQLTFPLALSFTPLMTAAGTEKHVATGSTLPDLGVAEARSGVDVGSSSSVQKEEQGRVLDRTRDATQKLWNVLGSSAPRERGVEMATGIVSGMANQTVQDWLGQYGNARFSFSAQGTGSADLLLPLLDSPDYLLYTQSGVRRGDDRTTGNFGLGGRFYMSDWMLGVNTFYDNDFTGNNRRLGLGVEAWRDYLKLSANSYMRLSDWHQSPLHESRDYDERPANGFDVRAEGWLPAWPQLGGKLMYEHYQGKDVALSGDFNSRRNSPSAVTAALSYTPFPLLKVGVEHRAGSGTGDTALNLDFTYRFGVPWSEQINPQMVGLTRTMAGTRYDLVDRNYNIVLQYRKQDLISLLLGADKNPGYAGESVTVTATARSKYGLARVDWSAPALLAAGGSLTPVAKDGSVVRIDLPSVVTPKVPLRARSVAAGEQFVIEAVAHDTEGNEARATLELGVERSPRDISARVVSNRSVADGKTVNTVEVMAQDGDAQQPLAGEEVELVFTYVDGPEKGKVLDTQTVKTDEQGRAVAEVSSRVAAGVNVSVRLKSNGNNTVLDMVFVADSATAKPEEPMVKGAEAGGVVANGRDSVTLTFPVKDANGNPVAGQEVVLTTTNGAKPERLTVSTDEQGNASVTVTSTVAGATTVTAVVNGESQSRDIVFMADEPEVSQTEFTVTPDVLVADGTQSALLNLVLKDGTGNRMPLSGDDVSFNVVGPDGVALSAVTCSENACASMLRGSVAGSVTLTPVVKGVSMSDFSRVVTLTASGDSVQTRKLTVVNNIAPADDRTVGVVQMKVTDAVGNPVENVHIEFSVDSPWAHFLITDYATNSQGVASASLVSPMTGEVHVTATVDGVSVRSDVITFVPDAGSARFTDTPAVSGSPAPADGDEAITLTYKVTDNNGNIIPNQLITLSVNNNAFADNLSLVTDDQGEASVVVRNSQSGTTTVIASVIEHSISTDIIFKPVIRTDVVNKIFSVRAPVFVYIPVVTTSTFGGTPDYSVSPALPAGLGLNSTNGVISGTPSTESPGTTYTMTVHDG